MSKPAIAMLYTRCGGHPSQSMLDLIVKQEENSALGRRLIKEVREKWDTLDARERGAARSVSLFGWKAATSSLAVPMRTMSCTEHLHQSICVFMYIHMCLHARISVWPYSQA